MQLMRNRYITRELITLTKRKEFKLQIAMGGRVSQIIEVFNFNKFRYTFFYTNASLPVMRNGKKKVEGSVSLQTFW
jgi:hypothetical protein